MTNQKYALLDVVKNKDKLIPFDHLDEESFNPAILELIAKVKETTNGITESKSAPSWNNIIDKLDDAEENLNFGWTIISHLNSVKDTPQLRKIVNELLPSISELYSWLGQNEELYAKYKDRGLNVVGVAVWDKPEDTEKAIKSHELPWPCIVNAQTIPTDLYGIQGIPCIIVINSEGIIVSRDKQSEALVKDVDEVMAAYKPMAAVVPAAEELADTVAAF